MKQKIFLLLALAAPTFGFSQNEYLNYKYSLSVNALFSHNYVQTSGVYEKGSSISGITSSFFIMDEAKNQHEISLEKLTLGSPDYYFDSYELRSNNAVDVSVGYKYHFNFMKRKTSRWIPSVGVGTHAFFRKMNFAATEGVPFEITHKGGGLQFYVQPAITCHINQRVFLSLSIPVNVVTAELRSDYYDNPAIPAEQRSITVLNSTGFTQFQGKIGAGVKF